MLLRNDFCRHWGVGNGNKVERGKKKNKTLAILERKSAARVMVVIMGTERYLGHMGRLGRAWY